jgi:hypothetical protein
LDRAILGCRDVPARLRPPCDAVDLLGEQVELFQFFFLDILGVVTMIGLLVSRASVVPS